MSSKISINSLFIILLTTNLFQLIISKSKEDLTKLVSCMTIIGEKLKGQTPEPKAYSSMLLKCFISISEEEKKEILLLIQKGIDTIESEEIEKLTDISSLNDIPQEQLKEYSAQLEDAINELRKIQESRRGEKKGEYEEDEDYRKNHPSRGNTLGAFMKKMTGTLKTINNFGNYVIGIIVIYFVYIMLGNCRRKKKNNINKEKEKENKKKDKKNKKKNE